MSLPPPGNLELVVDGRWLSLDCWYGDVEPSWVWPGGSDQLTFTLGTQPPHRFTGGETVQVFYGPVCIWAGTLAEPDPSTDQMAAVGAWQEAAVAALDGAGNSTKIPDIAIDAATGRGALDWTRPASLSATAVDIDTSQGPVTVGALLDAWATAANQRWGVDPYRRVYAKPDDTTPSWQTWPIDGGLGYDLTNYASTLIGRYYNGTSYATAIVTDPIAEAAHGYKEAPPIDLTGRGTLTSAKATTLLTNLLALGMATPSWTQSVGFSYGELLNLGGTPVALETIGPNIDGALLRVHGGFDLPQRQNGQLYLDLPTGRAALANGLLTVTPTQIATRNLADFVAKTSAKRLTA